MADVPTDLLTASGVGLLLAGLLVASVQDWKAREVHDGIWQVLGIAGAVLGGLAYVGDAVAFALWVVLAAFVLEHLFPWDAPLERYSDRLPGWIEIVVYIAVTGTVLDTALRYGVGSSGVPIALLAVLATVLLARGLFEVGVLYGGADAKALIVAGFLVPLFARPFWTPASAAGLLAIYPFALTVLINAALFAIVVPVGIAVRNASRHEFEFPRGFTGYRIPVDELPRRYVWLRDPTFSSRDAEEPEPETTEEDRALRERQAAELRRQGIVRVWVTPQLPFVLWILAGVVAALVAGNLAFDVGALL